MKTGKFEKLFSLLPESIDCALITSDVNRRYFSGMKSSAGVIAAFREKAYLIIDFRYYEKASKTVDACDVVLQEKLFSQINDLLKKHGAKKAAVEANSMTLSEFEGYKSGLAGTELDGSGTLSKAIEKMRGQKSPDEIEKIKKAQEIAEEAFENLLNHICEGKTERELALLLDGFMLKNGAEAISFDTIALSGANTSLPHGVPSDREIRKGDFLLFDFGAVYDGYHSDMTRTVCLGNPSEEMQKVYDIVLKAQLEALNAAKAGMKCSELDKIARDIISNAGYGENFGHSLGHGVGLEIHEFPTASPKSETVLEENMVVTVEPGIYLPGKFGVRIEDFAVITGDGCINLTNTSKNFVRL